MLTLNERISDLTAAALTLNFTSEEDNVLPWIPFSPRQVYFLELAQVRLSAS